MLCCALLSFYFLLFVHNFCIFTSLIVLQSKTIYYIAPLPPNHFLEAQIFLDEIVSIIGINNYAPYLLSMLAGHWLHRDFRIILMKSPKTLNLIFYCVQRYSKTNFNLCSHLCLSILYKISFHKIKSPFPGGIINFY